MEEMKLASDFQPLDCEANFGPPISHEVVGGAHIAPECVTIHGRKFVMLEWPRGLPRHENTRTVRFPHGLMKFGETMEACARRLVSNQMGFEVIEVSVAEIDSYVDEMGHWHIEPLLIVKVAGEPSIHEEASKLVEFTGRDLPDGAVWEQDSFDHAFKTYLKQALMGEA